MRGQIIVRVIEMHERAVDRRDALDHVLQALAEVVAVVQVGVAVEDDVDLDVELVARVVRLQALDVPDALGEARDQVQEHVALVGARGRTGQVGNVLVGGAAPVDHDVEGEE